MPTYEYQCSACQHKFERFQSIKAAPIKVCPACGKSKAKRLISVGAGFVFKGSGFYITDYRSQGYKDAAKADSSASTSTSTSGKSEPAKSGSTSDGKGQSSTPAPAASTPAPAKPAASGKK